MTAAATGGRRSRSAERELERLYLRHADDVRRQVLALLRGGADVDDLVQQTFLKALRALRAGVRPELPRPWLLAIARNECRQLFRAEARRPTVVALDETLATAPEPDVPRAGRISEALAELRPRQRQALVLREFEGRSYEEIAATLRTSTSAVETLLFRARRALREQLEATPLSCTQAAELLEAGPLSERQRQRLRAHARGCAACTRLERRRRGRLGALRRLGALLPAPSWLSSLFGGGGAKVAVVVAAAAVGAGGAVDTVHGDSARPAPAPQLVHRDAIRRPVARPAAVGLVPAAARAPSAPARRLQPRPVRMPPRDATRASHVVARPLEAPPPRRTPSKRTRPGPSKPAPAPTPTEAPAPPQRPRRLEPRPLQAPRSLLPPVTVPATTPAVTAPTLTTAVATTPAVTVPAVTTPVGAVPSPAPPLP